MTTPEPEKSPPSKELSDPKADVHPKSCFEEVEKRASQLKLLMHAVVVNGEATPLASQHHESVLVSDVSGSSVLSVLANPKDSNGSGLGLVGNDSEGSGQLDSFQEQ